MTQAEALLILLSDGEPHSTYEITRVVYGLDHAGVCRISARIKELRDRGNDIIGFKDKENRQKYWYQLIGDKSTPSECVAHASGEAPATPNFKNDLFEGAA